MLSTMLLPILLTISIPDQAPSINEPCKPELKLVAPEPGKMPPVAAWPATMPPTVRVPLKDGGFVYILEEPTACEVYSRLLTLEQYPTVAQKIMDMNIAAIPKPDWKWPVIGGFTVGVSVTLVLAYALTR